MTLKSDTNNLSALDATFDPNKSACEYPAFRALIAWSARGDPWKGGRRVS